MEQNRRAANQNAIIVNADYQQEQPNQEIDLVELFFALLHNWMILLLAFFIGALIMVGYYIMFINPTYRATSELYITNTDSVISLQDLQVGSALTEDYKTIITSRAVLKKVIADLQLDTDYTELRKLITVSNPQGTHIIDISVTTSDVETSKNIANDLLNVSIERIYQIIGTSEPTIIDYSEADAVEDVTPSLYKYIFLGGLVGVLLVAVFVVIRMLMDSTIKSDEDVEKYLRLPVLTAVPYFEE